MILTRKFLQTGVFYVAIQSRLRIFCASVEQQWLSQTDTCAVQVLLVIMAEHFVQIIIYTAVASLNACRDVLMASTPYLREDTFALPLTLLKILKPVKPFQFTNCTRHRKSQLLGNERRGKE